MTVGKIAISIGDFVFLRTLYFVCSFRPGDYVVWNREDEKRSAIVQSVNAAQRTATVLFPDTGVTELAPLLELDAHGTSDPGNAMAHDGLGVRRGDFVFIHPEGTTNGFESPRVPRIGELESWVRDTPFVEGMLSGWRKEMSEIGAAIDARRNIDAVVEGKMQLPTPGDHSLMWIGEVTSVRSHACIYPFNSDLRRAA